MPLITTNIERAIKDLNQGKPVAIPTETVYGLAARIDSETGIKTVFSLKQRPPSHPLIVHVAKNWDISKWVKEIPDYAQKLINHFWPGPITFIFHCKENSLNPLITAGQPTVAIRCPDHPLAQELLIELDMPLVAPSANPFGKISPTTAQHVKQSFSNQELTILDGGRCRVGIESTIIDATNPNTYQILRHGLIDEKAIASVVSTECLQKDHAIKAPGQLEHHYQPQKTVYYFSDYAQLLKFCKINKDSYVIASKQPPEIDSNNFHLLSNQPEQVAFDLFFQLRQADESNAKHIAIELPQESTKWQGVRERILKAGQPG